MRAYLMPLVAWLVAAGLLVYFGLLGLITQLVLWLLRARSHEREHEWRRYMLARHLWTRGRANGRVRRVTRRVIAKR